MAYPITEIKLNQNIITAALFNMIISQQIFDSGVASTELADRFRVDGTLFGDTKLYQSFDIGSPENWLNDAEATNLLAINRNKSGITQTITMGIYKIISITTDQYLSKQAFMADYTFSEYIGFMKSSLSKIKRVYDRSLMNIAIGTLTPSTNRCDITVTASKGATVEETNRLEAQTLAKEQVVLAADLQDNNRDFNKLNYLRSYSLNDMITVWNVDVHARITKLDLPTIYHNDINANGTSNEYDLPSKWFGEVGATVLTLPSSAPANVTKRVLVSGWYDVSATTATVVDKPNANKTVFLWAGDAVPFTGQVYQDYARKVSITVVSTTMPANSYYTVDPSIAFMLVHVSALPLMSGFETGTEFWNGRSLTSNNYLIFGHNNLEYLEEYPRIRVRLTTAPTR